MDFVRLAGLFDQEDRRHTPHRRGPDLRPQVRLLRPGGIAGEDDLDAPDTVTGPPSADEPRPAPGAKTKAPNGVQHKPATLSQEQSARERDLMLAELERLATDAELTAWAKDGLPRKN